jgi:hypothetical protein
MTRIDDRWTRNDIAKRLQKKCYSNCLTQISRISQIKKRIGMGMNKISGILGIEFI